MGGAAVASGSDCSSEFVSTGARTRTARPQVNYALVHHRLCLSDTHIPQLLKMLHSLNGYLLLLRRLRCSSEFVSTGAHTRKVRPQVNYALVHHCRQQQGYGYHYRHKA
jgi:hypothetical protein